MKKNLIKRLIILVPQNFIDKDTLSSFMSKFEKNSINLTSNSLGASEEKHLNQYFDTHKPPVFEYYQDGNKFFYRSDAVSGFDMPIDINLNGVELRINPKKDINHIDISEFSVIDIRDREFLMILKENPDLSSKDIE